MNKNLYAVLLLLLTLSTLYAQQIKSSDVPAKVKAVLVKNFPRSARFKILWEKEDGNYEANWGIKTPEFNAVVFTPAAAFVKQVVAIPINKLPASVLPYVQQHYKTPIKEADKVTDARGKTFYKAEVKGKKHLVFDDKGKFIKVDWILNQALCGSIQ